jgi:flagellar basal body rod protein FlgF
MFSGCHWHRIHGNGSIKTETRDVPAFDAISLDGGYQVQIDCQAKQSLAITTDENLLPLVKTEVRNNVLHVFTKGFTLPSDGMRLVVSLPNLTEFTSSGSSQGDINNINNSALEIEINGSGKLRLNGKSGDVKIHTSGSSKIDATALISEDSNVQINGSGHIQVYATNSVDVQINGSGTVRYKGDPKSVNQQINGSGTVRKE